MASNEFGRIFRITTFGESHGAGIGAVIDGCPAGVPISKADIDAELAVRQPGKNAFTSPRTEPDTVEILSGVFEGKSTGAPIALFIRNRDADSSKYEPIKDLYRPGHANYTYLEKYGIFDYRGGGRSSARETAARVAAGAVAKKFLALQKIDLCAFLSSVGKISINPQNLSSGKELKKATLENPIFCPDRSASEKMMQSIEEAKKEGDSLGGVVQCIAQIPIGLGDPVYGKLEALLAYGMLSLPATKGFEIGSGFLSATMKGSEHNDTFGLDENGKPSLETNLAGGTLGGISTGAPLNFRVAFKPTSSIKIAQKTVSTQGQITEFTLPEGSRHDPCVAIRAVPVVEAMTALILADAILMNRSAKI